ncbi:hypothetical protein TNCV_3213141 [Trichonephila clavipes]|nr:hypothetical protein TNCV_3213141 [Trichonephila clavipes]
MEEKEKREAPDYSQGVLRQNWGGTELNRTVNCMVLKATANSRSTSIPLPLVQSRQLETKPSRKGLSPDEIVNLMLKLSENESDGGEELFHSNLDFDEDIRFCESVCEGSEE